MNTNYDKDFVLKAVLLVLLKYEGVYLTATDIDNNRVYVALKKLYDAKCKAEKRLLRENRIKQKDLIKTILEKPEFKQKRKQKAFISLLSSGKKVTDRTLKKRFPINKSRGQTEQQWNSALKKLKGESVSTINKMVGKYFQIRIDRITNEIKSLRGYCLTVKEKSNSPYQIIR